MKHLIHSHSRLSFLAQVFQARDGLILSNWGILSNWVILGDWRANVFTRCLTLLAGLALLSPFAVTARADDPKSLTDWPQILGKNRDGQAPANHPLGTQWPAQAEIGWQLEIGSGFGGPAVVGNTVLALHRQSDKEILEAVSLTDGSQLWQCEWPATYQGRINPDEGPRCVPVVSGERVFCYGAAGDLACVRLSDGKLLWRRTLRKDYRADDGYFGAGSTPLATGNLLIVCLGGQSAGIVALNQESGETVWKATDYDASYASPVQVGPAEKPRTLVVTRLNTVLVDTESGEVLSDVRFGSRGPTVNAATPIPLPDNRYFLTASYGIGSLTLAVEDSDRLVEVTRNQALSSQYNSPVLIGDRIIGIDGRADIGVAGLRSLDASTQEIVWEQPDFGTAHLIAIGSQVLAMTLEGKLVLIDGQAESFKELANSELPSGTYRALPALSAKQLIVRNSFSPTRSKLICIELP